MAVIRNRSRIRSLRRWGLIRLAGGGVVILNCHFHGGTRLSRRDPSVEALIAGNQFDSGPGLELRNA